MKNLWRAAVLGTLISLTAACQAEHDSNKAASAPQASAAKAADSVKVENPFARAVPPGQANSAAFMTLVNAGDTEQSLVSAASSVANSVELHEHTMENGVMAMRQVPKMVIPAKGRTALQPGGYHIMLIGLKQNLAVGQNVDLKLTFADGSTINVNAPVQEVTPPAGGGHMH